MNTWQWITILLFGLAAVVLVFVWAFQRWGVYDFPQEAEDPLAFGLDHVIVQNFTSEDGVEIEAWLSKPKENAPVILSFYGNSAKIGGSMARLSPLMERGIGVVVMRYRGASGDSNRSTEESFAKDARALYDQLDEVIGEQIPSSKRVLHGLSLGSSVGARLAAERPFGAVILEASMTRACRYYTRRYLKFPFCPLMWTERYDTIDFIDKIAAPKLFVHGAKDQSLPVEWAVELADAAPDPKQMIVFPEGGHADLAKHGLVQRMSDFIDETVPFE